MRVVRWTIILAVAVALSASAAQQDPLQKLLPKSGDLGWTVMKDSHQYGKGEGLTEIYDGGYKQYTDAGVTEASKQTYQKGKAFLEIVLHRMKSARAARDFYDYWKTEAGKSAKNVSKPFAETIWITGGSAYGYLVTGGYLVIAAATTSDKKSVSDLSKLMRKTATATQPPKPAPKKGKGGK